MGAAGEVAKLDGVADQVLDKVKAAFKGNLLKGGGSSAEPEIQEIDSPNQGSPLVAPGGKRPSRGAARRQLCARTPTPTPLHAHGPVRARSSLIVFVLGLTSGVSRLLCTETPPCRGLCPEPLAAMRGAADRGVIGRVPAGRVWGSELCSAGTEACMRAGVSGAGVASRSGGACEAVAGRGRGWVSSSGLVILTNSFISSRSGGDPKGGPLAH